MATQAALIAGFAFSAIGTFSLPTNLAGLVLSYFYVPIFTICLIAALFLLTQATIVTMYGPSLALKGDDETSVKIASDMMKTQQDFILGIGAVSITALFVGAMILSWSLYPPGIAVITTIFYFAGYYALIVYGKRAYIVFVPEKDVTLDVQPLGNGSGGVMMCSKLHSKYCSK